MVWDLPTYLGPHLRSPIPARVATHLMLASVLQGLREERGLGLDFKSMLGPHTGTTLPDPSQVGPGPQQEWEPGKVTGPSQGGGRAAEHGAI